MLRSCRQNPDTNAFGSKLWESFQLGASESKLLRVLDFDPTRTVGTLGNVQIREPLLVEVSVSLHYKPITNFQELNEFILNLTLWPLFRVLNPWSLQIPPLALVRS